MSTVSVLPRITVRERLAAAAAGLVLLAAAAVILALQVPFRHVEAVVAAAIIGPVAAGGAHAFGSIIWFGLGTDSVSGFDITPLCSTVILFAPLLAVAGAMMLVRPLLIARTLLGLAVSLGIVAACNLVRYLLAAIALQVWGETGFEVIHRYVGSLLVIAGFIVALVLLLRRATSSHGPRRGRER